MLKRQSTGLDFAIIIYGINRATKEITIREVMYFLNEIINTDLINIVPQKRASYLKLSLKIEKTLKY